MLIFFLLKAIRTIEMAGKIVVRTRVMVNDSLEDGNDVAREPSLGA